VRPLDRRNFNTFAEVAIGRELARNRLQNHRLARIARCIDVGNVVASGLQCEFVGNQCSGADVENGAHMLCAQAWARCKRCVVLMARLSFAA
jgi:hypothetical protein